MNHNPPIPSPVISNNSTMGIIFLVHIRQSNKCGSTRKGETYTWEILHALEWEFPVSNKALTTFINSIRHNNQPGKSKESRMRSNSQQIVSYCLGVSTKKPALRKVDLESIPKRGSEEINMLKEGQKSQKKASHIVQPGLTYGLQWLER